MKKHLLIGTALLVAMGAFSQNGRLAKPNGFIESTPRNADKQDITIANSSASTFARPVKTVKHVINGNKVAAANIFTGSMNVFGYLVSQSTPLQYNKGVNAVSFIARKNGTYTASSNSNSGTIVGLWSTNLGVSWDETCMWTNATNLGRYPQGGIYNPLGNTNINNAYLVGSGPVTGGSGWLGNWYASKQITTPGNTTPGADQQAHLDASPTIKKHAMSRYAFTTIDGGLARSMATVLNDINGTTNAAYGLRGAAMVKGQFSAGAFVWSVDSFCPAVCLRSDGSGNLGGVPIQAWDDAGVVGYVILQGSRAGASPAMKGMQPIVYKTTNSGASWSLLPANDFADPAAFRGVYERMFSTASNTNIIAANFQGSEGFGAAVDINGQLHLASMVYGHYSVDCDSLGYRYTFGTESYSYPETGPFNYPIIYDFYTKTSGGWDYHMVDSMGTEGPSGTSGQPGYGVNPWTDGSAGKMDLDARLQVSRTDDGRKIFYSWTESDSSVVGSKWNIFPDIKMKGFDVTLNMVTPRMDITGTSTLVNSAFFHYMCNKAVGASSTCVTMPYTSTKNTTNNGGINVDTYYIDGIQICPSSFTVNPMKPTGISTTQANTVNFDVFNFPNPADDATTIIVGLKAASNFEVTFYNSIGQLIDTYKVNGQIGSNEINIDLNNFKAGIYFYNVKVGGSVVTKKLVVQ